MTKMYKYILPVWMLWLAAGSYLTNESESIPNEVNSNSQSWWYYLAFTIGIYSASLLSEGAGVVNLDLGEKPPQ